jgi:hypothetical protein
MAAAAAEEDDDSSDDDDDDGGMGLPRVAHHVIGRCNLTQYTRVQMRWMKCRAQGLADVTRHVIGIPYNSRNQGVKSSYMVFL